MQQPTPDNQTEEQITIHLSDQFPGQPKEWNPIFIEYPNGERETTKNWRYVLIGIAKHVHRLSPLETSNGKPFLTEPINRKTREISPGIHLYVHYSADALYRQTQKILRSHGHDPSDYKLNLKPKQTAHPRDPNHSPNEDDSSRQGTNKTGPRHQARDLRNRIPALTRRVSEYAETLDTEEATKHALVMPFLQELGYDVFNPNEVVPEFTADFFTKNGEKVDYAIILNGDPAILIECKKAKATLDAANASQLGRYLNATDAHIGVLTNGIQYQFFSELEQENRMDTTPFLVVDLSIISDQDYISLQAFTKENFDPLKAREAAATMRYTNAMQSFLQQALESPSPELINIMTRSVHQSITLPADGPSLSELARTALRNFIDTNASE